MKSTLYPLQFWGLTLANSNSSSKSKSFQQQRQDLKFKIKFVSGVSTGSVYKDVALLRNGFPAESVNNGSVIVIKTHEYGSDVRDKFEAAILLIRWVDHTSI